MTDQEWRAELQAAINGKTGEELKKAKKTIFDKFAVVFPSEYAWENGDRSKPTGVDKIASQIQADMRRVFGALYDPNVGYQAAREAAGSYY